MIDDKHLVVMRGIPGSGKTRWVERVAREIAVTRCSADHFFLDEHGAYKFDPGKIGEAHQQCFRSAVEAMVVRRDPVVIIDNTNISAAECAPYVLLGQSYGYFTEVVTILCDSVVAAERNVHGVPLDDVRRMALELAFEVLPSWWNRRIGSAEELWIKGLSPSQLRIENADVWP